LTEGHRQDKSESGAQWERLRKSQVEEPDFWLLLGSGCWLDVGDLFGDAPGEVSGVCGEFVERRF